MQNIYKHARCSLTTYIDAAALDFKQRPSEHRARTLCLMLEVFFLVVVFLSFHPFLSLQHFSWIMCDRKHWWRAKKPPTFQRSNFQIPGYIFGLGLLKTLFSTVNILVYYLLPAICPRSVILLFTQRDFHSKQNPASILKEVSYSLCPFLVVFEFRCLFAQYFS